MLDLVGNGTFPDESGSQNANALNGERDPTPTPTPTPSSTSIMEVGEEEGASVDSDTDSESDQPSAKKKKDSHEFQSSWLDKHDWLRYVGEKMFCTLCIQQKKDCSLTRGSTNYRTSTLTRHIKHKQHQQTLLEIVQRTEYEKSSKSAHKQMSTLYKDKFDALHKVLRNVYWLAKENMPMFKYPSMYKLLKLQGVNLEALSVHGDDYSSRTAGEEFLKCIVKTIEDKIDAEIKRPDVSFFSIMIDESTDITITKKLVIIMKYVDSKMNVTTTFLGNLGLKDPSVTADKLFSYMKTFIEKRGISLSSVMGFGSDGASIMTGCKNGVATQVKRGSPFCISIHCMAHRLNLASSQAADSVPYLKALQQVFTDLFRYFHQSSCRTGELAAIQAILELPEVKLKEVYEIRWIAFYSALEAVYKSWPALHKYFTTKAKEKRVAREKRISKMSKSTAKSSSNTSDKQSISSSRSSEKSAPSKPSDKTSSKSSDKTSSSSRSDKSSSRKSTDKTSSSSNKSSDKPSSSSRKSTDKTSSSSNTSSDKSGASSKKSTDKTSSSSNTSSDKSSASSGKSSDADKSASSDLSDKTSESLSKEEIILEMISDYKFVATMHMLMDVIPSVAALNLVFQKQALDISSVLPAVSGVLEAIQKSECGKGYYARLFSEKVKRVGDEVMFKNTAMIFNTTSVSEAKQVRMDFCKSLKVKIESRFPKDERNLVNAFGVLAMKSISCLSADEVDQYGEEEIDALTSHYGTSKVTDKGTLPPLIQPHETKIEWRLVKKLVVRERYVRVSTVNLWKTIEEFYGDSFPNLIKLAQLSLVLPLQTADVERSFSVQNQIKTAQRNRISPEMLNQLMVVNVEGQDIKDFDFQAAAEHWKSVKPRNLFN